MSDGPLYSPTMNKHCKRLAEASGNDATGIKERVELTNDVAKYAFKKEGGIETLKKINDTLQSLESDLFHDEGPKALEALRSQISPSAFSQSFLDNVLESKSNGLSNERVIQEGLANTLGSRIYSENRAIVEHCLGSAEVSQTMANKVRFNLNQSTSLFDAQSLAKSLIGNGTRSISMSRKMSSIDEGPAL